MSVVAPSPADLSAAIARLALPDVARGPLQAWLEAPTPGAPPALPAPWQAQLAVDGMRGLLRTLSTGAPPLRCLTVDRSGALSALLDWSADAGPPALRGAWLRTPTGGLALRPRSATNALWGPCDSLHLAPAPGLGFPEAPEAGDAGPPLALLPALDYARLRHLPPLDRPGALPPGAGSALLNLLALLAQDQGHASLPYRGPYPTDALYDSLTRSFVPEDTGDTARARFTAGFQADSALGHLTEQPLRWTPQPHWERSAAPGLLVQGRMSGGMDRPERIWLDGAPFTRGRNVGATLWWDHAVQAWVAGLRMLGQPWKDCAAVQSDGRLLADLRTEADLEDPPQGAPALAGPDWPEVVRAWASTTAHPALAAAVQALPPPRLVWTLLPCALAVQRGGTLLLHSGLALRFLQRRATENAAELAAMLLSDVLSETAPILRRQATLALLALPTEQAALQMRDGPAALARAREVLQARMPRMVRRLAAASTLAELG